MQVLSLKDSVNDSAVGLDEYSMDDEYDDIFNSSSAEDSFQHATLIATLAEKFNLTSFKPFQRRRSDFVIQIQNGGSETADSYE